MRKLVRRVIIYRSEDETHGCVIDEAVLRVRGESIHEAGLKLGRYANYHRNVIILIYHSTSLGVCIHPVRPSCRLIVRLSVSPQRSVILLSTTRNMLKA